MRKIVPLICAFLLTVACRKHVTAADLPKINGYWEIEKVVFPDGNKKEYTSSLVYDYFSIKDNHGFRKKVTPQLDGTFEVDNSDEKVTITQNDGQYTLHYLTPYAKWTESLVSVSDEALVTKNNSNKEYHYKRAAPINLISNGKKAQ